MNDNTDNAPHINANATTTPSDNPTINEDPLDIKSLSTNFDKLVQNINLETETLANQVYQHVYEKREISEESIENINAKLEMYQTIIKNCNELNMEIDKIEQLQLFTTDFIQRLSTLTTTLKNSKH